MPARAVWLPEVARDRLGAPRRAAPSFRATVISARDRLGAPRRAAPSFGATVISAGHRHPYRPEIPVIMRLPSKKPPIMTGRS
jgi:hypothetical protein